MDNAAPVLIAAISGRALAASARRGGYLPLVADFFGDRDTLRAAHAHVRLAGDLAYGIEEHALIRAIEALDEQNEAIGIVYGTGFEDRTQILNRIAQRWRLLGNGAETVAKIKDPESLSAMCAAFRIPFPEFSLSAPAEPDGWVAKRIGGAGGSHVKPASKADGDGIYYQRKMTGSAVAALFLADGERTTVLGFSAQWNSPAPRQPYRYGGAVRPAMIVAGMADELSAAVRQIAGAAALVGLNSADFLVDRERFCLLEVNPRPGATLDIFEPADGSLFALHVAACTGGLTATRPHYAEGAKAAAIVYADTEIPYVPALEWPDWTADQPVPASAIKAGEPVCTVYACAAAATGARALACERREMVLGWMRARAS